MASVNLDLLSTCPILETILLFRLACSLSLTLLDVQMVGIHTSFSFYFRKSLEAINKKKDLIYLLVYRSIINFSTQIDNKLCTYLVVLLDYMVPSFMR